MTTFSYTTGNPSNLTAGSTASMNDIQGPFTDIRTFLNGANLDFTNIGSVVQSDYNRAHYDRALCSGLTAQTYVVGNGSITTPGGAAALQLFGFYEDPASFALTGRTAKYNLRVSLSCNTTAPAVNLTFGLYPVTITAGGAGSGNTVGAVGTVTSGSTVLFTTPSGSSSPTSTSGDFTAPSAGFFTFGVVCSGSQAANSTFVAMIELLRRTV